MFGFFIFIFMVSAGVLATLVVCGALFIAKQCDEMIDDMKQRSCSWFNRWK